MALKQIAPPDAQQLIQQGHRYLDVRTEGEFAAEIMANAGYTNLCNMQGGFGGARDQMGRVVTPGWAESGLPVCKDCGPENSFAGLRAK
jgi:rhodanese-related sulfurtransferase